MGPEDFKHLFIYCGTARVQAAPLSQAEVLRPVALSHKVWRRLPPHRTQLAPFAEPAMAEFTWHGAMFRGTRRGALPGVDRNPKSSAACLANVRRVLEALRACKTMPLDHLYNEVAVRAGDAAVIRELILQMKKAYTI